ncbi:response regulator transcription factor [Bacillus sp. FJAT-49732]|uniref:Response regulator transcription factor n=1 Tax=Lederbergia citrisecunda TaxID=2833583 RepID=A0A942TPQ0_9BACI|nr:response regulator transcription factor [Lederbergia citrisecunda]MBS4200611.1 response regulator transcription factor [Lederbergia citrisecunda]
MSMVDIVEESNRVHECLNQYAKNYKPANRLLKRKQKNELPNLLILDLNSYVDLHRAVPLYLDQNIIVAVWISDEDIQYLPELLSMELHGYFYKDMKKSEVIYAVKCIMKGMHYIHPRLLSVLLESNECIKKMKPKRPIGLLTKREWDVLELIAKGYSNCAISLQLNIASKTVKSHVLSVLKKLKVDNRTNAATLAIKNNWFYL